MESDSPESNRPSQGDDKPIMKVDYIKSNYFRVVHADGIFGGLTPRGNIQMEIWSERQPIPKQTTYRLVEEGDGFGTPEEIVESRVVRDAFIREVEVGVVLDLGLAKSLIEWLKIRVEMLESAMSGANPSGKMTEDKP